MAERSPAVSGAPIAGATYRIRAVAQMTGVSEQLIRAWERRYGLLTPKRTPGGYRVYTEEDIAILRRIRELTEQGMAIGEVSRLVPQIRRELRGRGATVASPPVLTRVSVDGTRVAAWSDAAMAAVKELDQPRLEAILDEALAALPPVEVFEQLMAPVCRRIGEGWKCGELSVGEEHLGTEVFRARIRALLHGAPRGQRSHVLASVVGDEQHDMGLWGATLKLRLGGIKVTALGMRTPVEELARVAQKLHPNLVALSAVMDPGRAGFVRELRRVRDALGPYVPVIIGGGAAARHPDVAKAYRMEVHADLSSLDKVIAHLR